MAIICGRIHGSSCVWEYPRRRTRVSLDNYRGAYPSADYIQRGVQLHRSVSGAQPDWKNNNKKTLDLCCGNIPNGYISVSLPPLGTSDHSTIRLIPAYRSKIQTEQVVKKGVKVWWCGIVEQLQGWFDCTDWDLFIDSCDNIHDATDDISDKKNKKNILWRYDTSKENSPKLPKQQAVGVKILEKNSHQRRLFFRLKTRVNGNVFT